MFKLKKTYLVLLLATGLLILLDTKIFGFSQASSDELNVKGVNVISKKSNLLSNFHKKNVTLNFSLILPLDFHSNQTKEYPTIFHIPGFGGTHLEAFKHIDRIRNIETENPELSFIHVYLDPSFATGHHGFVDSEYNGPMEQALVQDLIPQLQNEFKVSRESKKLFLTGHSSGAWSAIWIMLNKQDLFAGAWVSAPDPLTFKDFYGVDLTPGSADNIFNLADGTKRVFFVSNRDTGAGSNAGFSIIESEVISNEFRYSKNIGSEPQKIYDRSAGLLNQDALKQWEKFDVLKLVTSNFSKFEPALNKIKIVTGKSDNYFLDKPTSIFCDKIDQLGVKDRCLFIPARDHFNLYFPETHYESGLDKMFYRDMRSLLKD